MLCTLLTEASNLGKYINLMSSQLPHIAGHRNVDSPYAGH